MFKDSFWNTHLITAFYKVKVSLCRYNLSQQKNIKMHANVNKFETLQVEYE